MYILDLGKLPVYSWIAEEEIEAGALAQAANLANHPHVAEHVVLLPDVHTGYGMPIGCVVAMQNHLCPAAVGYDIGCGISAVKTGLQMHEDINELVVNDIISEIRENVPVGHNWRKKEHNIARFVNEGSLCSIASSEINNAKKQVGTLGGENHFIEIQRDLSDYIWVMIHTGSRNVGWKIADYYIRIANENNTDVPDEFNLATLHKDSDFGYRYLAEMQWAKSFAYFNRCAIIEDIKNAISTVTDNEDYGNSIYIYHNYASYEFCNLSYCWVHRKGAISAYLGEDGIIPGSQGTKSYIITGKGSQASLNSCSHGAGRTMSRTKARNTLDFDEEVRKLDEDGVLHSIRNKKGLDEAPVAYKDIDRCIALQSDLVSVEAHLTPLGVIKG